MAWTVVLGSWNGESASDRAPMSTRSRIPYATSFSSVRSSWTCTAEVKRPAHPWVRPTTRRSHRSRDRGSGCQKSPCMPSNRHPHREEPPKGAGSSPGKRAIGPCNNPPAKPGALLVAGPSKGPVRDEEGIGRPIWKRPLRRCEAACRTTEIERRARATERRRATAGNVRLRPCLPGRAGGSPCGLVSRGDPFGLNRRFGWSSTSPSRVATGQAQAGRRRRFPAPRPWRRQPAPPAFHPRSPQNGESAQRWSGSSGRDRRRRRRRRHRFRSCPRRRRPGRRRGERAGTIVGVDQDATRGVADRKVEITIPFEIEGG